VTRKHRKSVSFCEWGIGRCGGIGNDGQAHGATPYDGRYAALGAWTVADAARNEATAAVVFRDVTSSSVFNTAIGKRMLLTNSWNSIVVKAAC
jgi:hypothetical protein